MRRLTLRAAGLLAIALSAITCTDASTGPGSARPTASRLRMAPSFSPSAARAYTALADAGIIVTQVHIVLRNADGTVAKDTLIAFPAGQDTLSVQLPMQIQGSEQTFMATLDLLDAGGVVLFSRTQPVTARASGLPDAPPPAIVLEYVGPGHAARTVSVSPSGLTLQPGVAQPLVAGAVDSSGATITDLLVSWSSSDSSVATVAATGRGAAAVTGTGRRGPVTITATTPTGIAGHATFTLLPRPTSLLVVSGDAQTGVAGHALAQPLVLELRGLDNLPIAGAAVVVTPVTAGASVGSVPADTLLTTDGAGRAAVPLTLGRTAGAYAFQAKSGAVAAPAVTATATAAPAAALAIASGAAQAGPAGSALPQPFVVTVTNEFGDPVAGATVNWTRAAGAGALAAATSVSDAQGRAAMSYTLGSTAGSDTVRATLPGLTAPSATALFVATTTAGAAARLSWLTEPADPLTVGAPFPPFSARLADRFGNVVRTAGTKVIVRGRATNGTATDSTYRDSTLTDTAGVARFSVGPYTGLAGSLAITVASAGLDSLVKQVTTQAGAAAALSLTGPVPATVASGVAITPPIVLQVVDAGRNPVAGIFSVTASLQGGGTQLGGPLTVTTSADGRASFSGLVISGVAGSYTLRFDAAGMAGVASAPIAVTGGVAASLAATAGTGQSGTVATALPVRPAVRVTDANGNAVRTGRVVFTARNGGSAAPDTVAVDASGGAATTWTLGPVAGADTLVARLEGTTLSPVTFTATAAPGAPTQFVIVAGDGQTAVAGTAVATAPRVRAMDSRGNGIAGVRVTFRALAPLSTLSNGTTSGDAVDVITDASGVAALASWTLGTTAGSYGIEARSTPEIITSALGFTATATAGAPARWVTTASATSVVAGQPVSISAQLVDASGNPVRASGHTASWSASVTGGAFAATTSPTDANGVAQVGYTTPTTAGRSIVVTATEGSLTGSAPAITTVAGTGTMLGFAGGSWLVSGTTASGTAFVPQPVVQLLDANGNPVATAGLVVAAAVTGGPAGATLAGATATTDATGRAAFGALAITGTAGAYTLGFTSTGYPPLASSTLQVGAGAASRLVFATQPPSSVASLAPFTITVSVTDASGNLVTSGGDAITLGITSGTGALLVDNGASGAATVSRAAVNGIATFSGLAVDVAGSGYQLTAGTAALPSGGAASTTFAVTPGAGTQLILTAQPTGGTSGVPLDPQPVVRLRDDAANFVLQPGVVVTATLASGSGTLANATATTDASGTATFAGLTVTGTAGTIRLAFGATGYTTKLSNAIALAPGTPTRLVVVTAPSATVSSGSAFAQPPVIQVRDASGNAAGGAGIVVTASVTSGTGTLSGPTTATTDNTGTATFTGLGLSGTAGPFTLGFGATGLTPASATTTLTAGAVAAMSVTPSTLAPVAGDAITVQAQLRDGAGNAIAAAGHTIAWTASVGGGLFVSETSTTNASGIAVATYTTPTTAGTAFSLTATEGTATGSTSTITTVAGAAARLAFRGGWTVSSATASGTPFSPQPVIQVTDAQLNPVAASGVVVTAVVTSGPAGATLAGATATADGAGRATFTALGISGVAGSYTLDFTATGLASTPSPALAIGAGAPAAMQFSAQPPSSVAAGAEFSVTVAVRDAAGNVAGTFNGPVSLALTSGTGTAGAALHDSTGAAGSSMTVAAVNGIAQFRRIWVDSAGTGYTLATTGVGSGATSGAFAVVPGAGTRLTLTTAGPASTPSGAALDPQPVVQLRDALGNVVPQAGVTVTASIASGTGSLANTSATTDASGVATFAGLTISGPTGSVVLSFGATGYTSAAGPAITITAGAPGQLSLFTAPSSTATSGQPFAQPPVIQVQDASGSAVAASGISVTASITSGSGSLIGTTTRTTDVTGKATFDGLGINGVAGPFTLSFSAPSLAPVTAGVTVSAGAPGAATHFVVVSGAGQSATVTEPLASPVVVEARDANEVPVPGVPFVVNYDRYAQRNGYIEVTGLQYNCDCYPPRDSILTDGSGRASFTWHVSAMAKVDSVSIGNLAVGFSTTTATAVAGPATGLLFVAPAGLDDDLGNVLSPFSVVFTDLGGVDTVRVNGPVTLTLGTYGVCPDTGCGTVTGTSTMTVNAVNGVATFTDIGITKVGTYFFTASGGGFTAQSDYFDISPVGPHFVVVGSYPSSTPVGTTLTIQLRSQTAHGDSLPNTPVVVSTYASYGALHLTNGTQGGQRDSSITDASGLVTLTWTMPTTTQYGMVASVFNDGTSSNLDLNVTTTPGPLAGLSITAGTLDAEAGATLPGIYVQPVDSYGNSVYSSSGTITATLLGDPSGTLGGSLVKSAAYGYFNDLTVSAAGSYRIQFAFGAFTAQTAQFTISPAAIAANSLLVVGSSQLLIAPSGTTTMTVRALDGQGQPLPSASINLTTPASSTCGIGAPGSNGEQKLAGSNGEATWTIYGSASMGGCYLQAVSGSAAAAAQGVVYAGTATHVWFGNSPSTPGDWDVADNWLRTAGGTATVPTTTDVVYVPGSVYYYPAALSGTRTIAGLTLGYGAQLSLGGSATSTLTVDGNVDATQGYVQNGTVLVAGANRVATGYFERLALGRPGSCATDSVTVTNISATVLTANCAVGVYASAYATTFAAPASSRLTLADGTAYFVAESATIDAASMIVHGGFYTSAASTVSPSILTVAADGGISASGDLVVGRAGGTLTIAPNATVYGTGDVTLKGSGQSDGTIYVNGTARFTGGSFTLPSGDLYLLGNFEQLSSAPTAFQPSGTHHTSFSGTTTQTVVLQSPLTSYFHNVLVASASSYVVMPSGARIHGAVTVQGALALTDAIVSGNIDVYNVAGVLTLYGANSVPNSPGGLLLHAGTTLNVMPGASLTGGCSRPQYPGDGVTIAGSGTINGQALTPTSCTTGGT